LARCLSGRRRAALHHPVEQRVEGVQIAFARMFAGELIQPAEPASFFEGEEFTACHGSNFDS
jgi:hypothetical protein